MRTELPQHGCGDKRRRNEENDDRQDAHNNMRCSGASALTI
jgi:hypothetical protein